MIYDYVLEMFKQFNILNQQYILINVKKLMQLIFFLHEHVYSGGKSVKIVPIRVKNGHRLHILYCIYNIFIMYIAYRIIRTYMYIRIPTPQCTIRYIVH